MSQYRMGLVRLFEALHFLFGQLDINGGNGLFEMIHLGGADDRASHDEVTRSGPFSCERISLVTAAGKHGVAR